MLSNAKLFSVGDFDFRLQHLLIIGILAIAVSTSALLRAQPLQYGHSLNEFDPFFNYRATSFIVNNGYDAYLEWHDNKSWYPFGRDISATSQSTLHLTTASLYVMFGGNSTLYDFTIYFPIVIGALTSIIVFAFVRVIGGTTAGLIAALMFSISIPILLRGMAGWFKSEPLGLFFGFLAIYFFISGLKTNKGKISFVKLIFGGIFFALGFSSWGGIQFFLLPLAVFFIALPFFNNDNKFLLWAIPTFSVSLLISSLAFERPGLGFVTGYGGVIILLPTVFMVIILIVQKFSNVNTKIRNSLIVLGIFIASGVGIISAGNIGLPSFRYLNAVNPFLTSKDPLVSSVSEHMSTTLTQSFTFFAVFIIFGLIGAWLLFSFNSKNSKYAIPNHIKVFALIFGLIGIYTSSAFVRLELFGSIALIILGAIGLTILLQQILEKQNIPVKFIFCIIIIGLFITPMILPQERNWTAATNQIPTIFYGASFFNIVASDWFDTADWLRNNTSYDSVIFSWWDYGYYIQTLGERTTLIDNATLLDWQIEKVARTFMSQPNDAWVILNSDVDTDVSAHYITKPRSPNAPDEFVLANAGLDSDYILIYLASQKFESTDGVSLYDLQGGGDESKFQWFLAIAGEDKGKYVESDGTTPTPYFWDNTLLGQLIPFTPITYVDPETMAQYDSYKPGSSALYMKNIKLLDPDGPFTLVYASPSFSDKTQGHGVLSTILIYKVNHDFIK